MLKTIADVVALMVVMSRSDDKQLQDHALTLFGPRTRGSTTKKGLEDINQATRLEDVTVGTHPDVKQPGCTYYEFYSRELGGLLGALSYQSANAQKLQVLTRTGAHGPELYVNRSSPTLPAMTLFTVIVGKFGLHDAVFTWHPGPPLLPLTAEGPKPFTAVKLHNG